MIILNNFKLSDNFNLREFQCRCCGQVKLDSELVGKLQQLRTKVGKPVIVSSGYRCPTHNKNVDGAPKSQHMEGKAADIRVSGITPEKLANLATQIGFNGIGIYPTFVHVDVRQTPARWIG